jgi:general secretion pathway protein G
MEIMLVLVILAILGGMATIFLRGAQQTALIRSTRAEIAVFKQGLEAYQLDMFAYPQSQDSLNALLTAPSNNSEKWTGPYIEPNDLKDPWGNDYVYELTNNGNSVVVKSPGPDQSIGTEDDITSADQ